MHSLLSQEKGGLAPADARGGRGGGGVGWREEGLQHHLLSPQPDTGFLNPTPLVPEPAGHSRSQRAGLPHKP